MRLLLLHCPEDVDGANALVTHLDPVCRQHGVERLPLDLEIGADIDEGLKRRLHSATHVVVLVSAQLLVWKKWDSVVRPSLAARPPAQVSLVWWKACLTEDETLRRFGPIPDTEPVASTRDCDAAWTQVASRVDAALRQASTGPGRVALGDLPSPEKGIIGRQHEKGRLDEALRDLTRHVVVVIGEGGAGKTQLVRTWLDGLQPAYGGVDAVVSCVIEAQAQSGPSDETAAVSVLLRALGEEPMEDALQSAHKLVERVRRRPTLLVIDGLEPLLDRSGKVQNRPMRTLLRDMASQMSGGLCIVTTRPPFTELEGFSGVKQIELGPMDAASAIALLRTRGVRGAEDQLARAAEDLGRHPLSLALVADYLREAFGGDVQELDRLDLSAQDIDDQGRLDRILSWHEQRLSPEERAILGVVALCERPCTVDWLEALASKQALAGFAAPLARITQVPLRKLWDRLQKTALLHEAEGHACSQHPLVSAWWRQRLESSDPTGTLAVHGRLFELFRDPPGSPCDGVRMDDLGPLYAAVAHGVKAERWADAYDVLHDRIREGEAHTSLKMRGAVTEDLRAFFSFFDRDTLEMKGELDPPKRQWLENSAGVLLRAQGRAKEAVRLLEKACQTAVDAGLVAEAAESARNVASALSLLGDLKGALESAEQSVRWADISGQARRRVITHDFRAHLLHRFGRLREARLEYEEVERIRDAEGAGQSGVAHYPFASHSALLIDLDEKEAALDRARRAFRLTDSGDPDAGSLLNRGLSLRTLARALAALGRRPEAEERFAESTDLVRQAGRSDHLAPSHIDWAWFLAATDCHGARQQLHEARRIFEGRGFRLMEADAALVGAQIALAEKDPAGAAGQLDTCERLLRDTGYRLRTPNLHLLRADLHALRGEHEDARREAALAEREAGDMQLRRSDLLDRIAAHLGAR
jgi:tetratricopeptide (TPR) repeat protein